MSEQTASLHYYAKRRLELKRIFVRLRGGASMRDIGREVGCSRSAIAGAVLRLGRQAMGAHALLVALMDSCAAVSFDGLVSPITGSDYHSQITTLGATGSELLLAMSHCVSERGGTRNEAQLRRSEERRRVWRPKDGSLRASISLLVRELSRFTGPARFTIDTDQHPIYAAVMNADLALGWYRSHRLLQVRTTASKAPRTTANPLFLMNYLERMIRHRMKEHTRESIGFARNATMQMHRMWIFAWDHNCCQPMRVRHRRDRSRAEHAGLPAKPLAALRRSFFSQRLIARGVPMPHSMRQVWTASLKTPPVRWRVGQAKAGPSIPAFALRDLALFYPHAP